MEFDLHCHSRFSFDSEMDVFQILETAKRRGLNGIAITDHETIEGGKAARLMADPLLKVIPGIEVNSEIGDIIGLFVTENIPYKDPFDVVKAIQDQDGIAIIPHPFRGRGKIPVALLDLADGIECYNARYYSRTPLQKQVAVEHLMKLAQAHGLAPIGVSDSHTYGEIGLGTTEIGGITTEDIKAAIRNAETRIGQRKATKAKSLTSAVNSLFFPKAEEPGKCVVRVGDRYETRYIADLDKPADAEEEQSDRMNPYGMYEEGGGHGGHPHRHR